MLPKFDHSWRILIESQASGIGLKAAQDEERNTSYWSRGDLCNIWRQMVNFFKRFSSSSPSESVPFNIQMRRDVKIDFNISRKHDLLIVVVVGVLRRRAGSNFMNEAHTSGGRARCL